MKRDEFETGELLQLKSNANLHLRLGDIPVLIVLSLIVLAIGFLQMHDLLGVVVKLISHVAMPLLFAGASLVAYKLFRGQK